MTGYIPPAALEAARRAAIAKLGEIYDGQLPDWAAREIADAALAAAYPEMATHFLQTLMGGRDQTADTTRND